MLRDLFGFFFSFVSCLETHSDFFSFVSCSGTYLDFFFSFVSCIGTYLDLTTSGGGAEGSGPGQCRPCHPSCGACSGGALDECVSCPPGAFLQNRSVCVQNCDSGKKERDSATHSIAVMRIIITY